MALSGKGGTGVANGLPECSKTPRETYTSHFHQTPPLISAPSYESSANAFPTPRTVPRRLSQTYPSHNEAFHIPDGRLSKVNREEAGNGERLKVGQRRCGFRWRKNLTRVSYFLVLKRWRRDTIAVAVSPVFDLLVACYPELFCSQQVERRFSNARWLVSSPGQKYMNDSEKNDFELCQKAS
jgi:hypothetical protein